MSGIGGGGNVLEQLLDVIADPEKFRERIKDLKDQEIATHSALNTMAQTSKKIAEAVDDLNAQREQHEQDLRDFAATKNAVQLQAANFDRRERDLAQREQSMEAVEKDFAAQKATFDNMRQARTSMLDTREKNLMERERNVSDAQAEVGKMKGDLADKLAQIKRLAT